MSINSTTFSLVLKLADVTPMHKEDLHYQKSNYSKYQTGFRICFIPPNCLVAIIKNFRNCLDQGNKYALLLMDLSKALDSLPHDLIIAKLTSLRFKVT